VVAVVSRPMATQSGCPFGSPMARMTTSFCSRRRPSGIGTSTQPAWLNPEPGMVARSRPLRLTTNWMALVAMPQVLAKNRTDSPPASSGAGTSMIAFARLLVLEKNVLASGTPSSLR